MNMGTYYDQIAQIVPGTLGVVLLTHILGFMTLQDWVLAGPSGVVLLALAGLTLGFLLRPLGSWISPVLRLRKSPPTMRIRSANNKLLNPTARQRLIDNAENWAGAEKNITDQDWETFTRVCMLCVAKSGYSGRVDLFLASYALSRNLALVFLAIVVYSIISQAWAVVAVGFTAFVAACLNAWYFDSRYASEMFLSYLQLSENPKNRHLITD